MLQSEPKQMSESILIGALLILSGGFLDAYSYLCRGGVFANAQTGNIALLGISLAQRNFSMALQYALPILVFAFGVYLATRFRWSWKDRKAIHWRQIILAAEILLLFFTAFIGPSFHWLANSMISFVCALQAESFRKIHGNACATTMCTGNLRSAAEWMFNYQRTGEYTQFKKSLLYYSLVVLFAVGAMIGGLCSSLFSYRAIWVTLLPLTISFFLMFQLEDPIPPKEHISDN